jgi:hypothetical protein
MSVRLMNSLSIVLTMMGLLTGCSSTSVTPVGSRSYPPLQPAQDVAVFSSPADVGHPYEVVGIISHTDPGKYQILTLGDAIPDLKEKARQIGANGIIIDQATPVKSGIISTGVSVTARAIRFHE